MDERKWASTAAEKRTRNAFLLTRIFDTPFWVIFNMLPFILYKDLHASPTQLAVIIALKPLSSILSMYWSSLVYKRPDRLVSNIIWGGVMRHLPFFFFPFVDNPWFFIAAFGFNMMLHRGTQPAWMETLKTHLPGVEGQRIFALGSALCYIGDALLPFALGPLLDNYLEAWRWLFPLTALASMASLYWQNKIPTPKLDPLSFKNTFSSNLLFPWKAGMDLLFNRPDFTRFQIGFMLAGSGLMVMQPVLPVYFVDVLNLSYTELAVAIATFKGIGFALATPFWTAWINRVNIYKFTSLVTALITIFPLSIILSQYNIAWLYLGYLCYGIMQAGSNLSWNFSGPIFSKNEDSSLFTGINVVTVGLRGSFAPFLGSAMGAAIGAPPVLLIGSILTLIAAERLTSYAKNYPIPTDS